MDIRTYEDPKKSLILYELGSKLNFLIKLYNSKKFPKVLMITGLKGIGKSTLINHLLNYIYVSKQYNLNDFIINNKTSFYNHYINNTFSNIIYLNGINFNSIKIEDIRDLKSNLLKSTISNKERFIILDDIEKFNKNSLNALLKIVEYPPENSFFIFINNKTKPLIETIYSRSLEIKITLTEQMRIKIIESLIKKTNLDIFIDYKISNLTPGNFLIFNEISKQYKIDNNEIYLKNFQILVTQYKKTKDINLMNMLLYLTDFYFYKLINKKINNFEKIIDTKHFVVNNINKFITYNLNPNSLINAISGKLNNG